MVCVADAANIEGEHAHPGIANVCDGSLYGRRQAGKILAELVADGWLVVESDGGGSGRATVYAIPGMNCALSAHPGNRALSDEEPRTLSEKPRTLQPEPRTLGVRTNGLPTVTNNGLTPTRDDFETFWLAYPKARRTAKPDARSAFVAAVRKKPAADIIAAAVAYEADPNRLDEFTPYPQKWLKQERWNAPPEPRRGTASRAQQRQANNTEAAAVGAARVFAQRDQKQALTEGDQ